VRKYLIGLLLVCQTALAQPDPFPHVAVAYQVEVNDAVLWEKAAAKRLPPASLTKLMTALLVLDDYAPQAVVQVSRAAAHESGTRLGLKQGERYALQDLLSAALLDSDNDACHALADHVAGDEGRFVARMNRRAQELGMRDTRFANACGHDAQGHYSTAHDLALLAHAAMKSPVLSAIVAQGTAQISTLGGARSHRLENKNALIGRYPGAAGLKSGYTPKAGKCLIAHAERGGVRVLLVMLNAPNRWWDASDILDLAFAHAQHTPDE
jgi:serine-type D-Ala-D-Ala carboxypeptidase (penicillin-binding protein 5/6)